jgi:hypothetical protein
MLNWVGFFLAYCLCYSIAARCGAIAGIGASFVKLAVFMQVGTASL